MLLSPIAALAIVIVSVAACIYLINQEIEKIGKQARVRLRKSGICVRVPCVRSCSGRPGQSRNFIIRDVHYQTPSLRRLRE
jgi:hypothetical protein